MITEANILRALFMHTILPALAIVAVVVLAALSKISGTDAIVVITAAAGIGANGITSLTAGVRKADAPTVQVSTEPGAIRSIGTAGHDG